MDHAILIRKLGKCNFHYSVTELLRSYLAGRTKFVALGGRVSEEGRVDVGLPFLADASCVFFAHTKTVTA